jgi:hypothetical protein
MLTSLQCGERKDMSDKQITTQRNKHTMSNDNLAIYTGYQYRVHVQGYEVIEVDMYMGRGKVTRQQER